MRLHANEKITPAQGHQVRKNGYVDNTRFKKHSNRKTAKALHFVLNPQRQGDL